MLLWKATFTMAITYPKVHELLLIYMNPYEFAAQVLQSLLIFGTDHIFL